MAGDDDGLVTVTRDSAPGLQCPVWAQPGRSALLQWYRTTVEGLLDDISPVPDHNRHGHGGSHYHDVGEGLVSSVST